MKFNNLEIIIPYSFNRYASSFFIKILLLASSLIYTGTVSFLFEPFIDACKKYFVGLTFNKAADNTEDEMRAISVAVSSFAKDNLREGYEIETMGVKGFGDLAAVRAVVKNSIGINESYRMIMGKIDGKWQPITNLRLLLSEYENPNISSELLNIANAL